MLELKSYEQAMARIIAENHYSESIEKSIECAFDAVSDGGGYKFGEDVYWEDGVYEAAEDCVSIYNDEVKRQALWLEDAVASCIQEGLIELREESFNLTDVLRCAWAYVIRRECEKESAILIYNFMADYLNTEFEDFGGHEEEISSLLWEMAESGCTQENETFILASSMTYGELESYATEIYNKVRSQDKQ